MTDFENKLKVDKEVQEMIDSVSEHYRKNGMLLEDEDRKKLGQYVIYLNKRIRKEER